MLMIDFYKIFHTQIVNMQNLIRILSFTLKTLKEFSQKRKKKCNISVSSFVLRIWEPWYKEINIFRSLQPIIIIILILIFWFPFFLFFFNFYHFLIFPMKKNQIVNNNYYKIFLSALSLFPPIVLWKRYILI